MRLKVLGWDAGAQGQTLVDRRRWQQWLWNMALGAALPQFLVGQLREQGFNLTSPVFVSTSSSGAPVDGYGTIVGFGRHVNVRGTTP